MIQVWIRYEIKQLISDTFLLWNWYVHKSHETDYNKYMLTQESNIEVLYLTKFIKASCEHNHYIVT